MGDHICGNCKDTFYEIHFFDDGIKPDGFCRKCKTDLSDRMGKRVK